MRYPNPKKVSQGFSGQTFRLSKSQLGEPHIQFPLYHVSCAGIKDVDLYGRTRHSTAKAMRLIHSPEQIKRATMHKTNNAFDRYFQIELEDFQGLYDMGTIRGQKKAPTSGYKILKLNK